MVTQTAPRTAVGKHAVDCACGGAEHSLGLAGGSLRGSAASGRADAVPGVVVPALDGARADSPVYVDRWHLVVFGGSLFFDRRASMPATEAGRASVLPRPPVTPTRHKMEAARAEEGEPPTGSLTLSIRTLTGDTTTLRDAAPRSAGLFRFVCRAGKFQQHVPRKIHQHCTVVFCSIAILEL